MWAQLVTRFWVQNNRRTEWWLNVRKSLREHVLPTMSACFALPAVSAMFGFFELVKITWAHWQAKQSNQDKTHATAGTASVSFAQGSNMSAITMFFFLPYWAHAKPSGHLQRWHIYMLWHWTVPYSSVVEPGMLPAVATCNIKFLPAPTHMLSRIESCNSQEWIKFTIP